MLRGDPFCNCHACGLCGKVGLAAKHLRHFWYKVCGIIRKSVSQKIYFRFIKQTWHCEAFKNFVYYYYDISLFSTYFGENRALFEFPSWTLCSCLTICFLPSLRLVRKIKESAAKKYFTAYQIDNTIQFCCHKRKFFCRSSRPEVFCKKAVLSNFVKITEKYLCQSLFFNKVAGLRVVFSCKFCEICKNTFSYKTPPVAASVSGLFFF